MTAELTLPREEIRPDWRAAVLAYQRELRATREDRLAWPVALAAFCELLPQMPEAQAKHETTHAIRLRSSEPYRVVLGRRLREREMSRSYDNEAMKPLGPRLEPPPPWWRKCWPSSPPARPCRRWHGCWGKRPIFAGQEAPRFRGISSRREGTQTPRPGTRRRQGNQASHPPPSSAQ